MNLTEYGNFKPQKCYNLWTKENNNGIISNYNKIFSLNETAFDIWNLINGSRNINDIINEITNIYDTNYTDVKKDCITTLKYFHENNLAIIDYDPLFKLGKKNKKIDFSLYEQCAVRNTEEKEIDILLITPPSPKYEANVLEKNYSAFPLGIGYLLAALNKYTSVKYAYLNLRSQIITEKQINDLLNKIKPSIIGISCMTENYLNGIRLIKYIKETVNYPFLAIAGGPHISLCYPDILNEKIIDYCFIGESESSIVNFMTKYKNNQDVGTVKGIAYINKNNNNICFNKNEENNNLDSLEFPIIDNRTKIGKYFVTISGSRGCPFSCKFCAAGKLSGCKYRFRSINNIIEEINTHYKKGIKNFGFIDDTITVFPERVKELCKIIKERNMEILWNAESRVDVAAKDKDMLKEMYSCGCRMLQFGIEAGTNSKLIEIKKNITINQIEKALDNAFDVGLQISGTMVVGLPNENEESIIKTFEFAETLQKNYPINIVVGWFVPYPGTLYRDELLSNNNQNYNLFDFDIFTTLHPNFNYGSEEFYKYQNLYFNHMIKIMKNNTSILKDLELHTSFFDNKNEYN